MNVFPLAIPLTTLLSLTNLDPSAFARGCRIVLGTSTCFEPLLMCDFRFIAVVLAHGPCFPFANTASHELGTIGFSDIAAFDEEIEDTHIPPVVIHFEFAPLEPTEQSWADITAPVEGKAAPALHRIAVSGGFPVDRFHQEQLEIIWGTQITWNTTLCHGLVPQDRTFPSSQIIPSLLVIIDH